MKLNLTRPEITAVLLAVAVGWAVLALLHRFGLPDFWYGLGLGVWIVALVRAAEIEHNDTPHDDDEETRP